MNKIIKSYIDAVSTFWNSNVKGSKWYLTILAILFVVLVTAVIISAGIAITLGIYWLMWKLYAFVVPYWFPTAKIPNYWMFAGTIFGVIWVRNIIFAGFNRKKIDESKD